MLMFPEELQAIADALNMHAIALAIIAGTLAIFAYALSWTGLGFIMGAGAIVMTITAIAVALKASKYSKEARQKREQAMKILGG